MSHTKLAPLLLLTRIRWLMDLAAYQGPRRILQINEEPCREHHIASEPAWQAQECSELRGAVPYNQWVSGNDGRSDRFHSGVAWKLDTYVWIHVRWIYPNSLVSVKYILIAAQKDKAIEMRDKLDSFRDRFMVDLMIEMRVKQGLLFVLHTDWPTWLICGIRCHSRWREVCACWHCKSPRWAVYAFCLMFVK